VPLLLNNLFLVKRGHFCAPLGKCKHNGGREQRCGCYLLSWEVSSSKTQMVFIFLKNTSNIPVDNGSSFNSFQAIGNLVVFYVCRKQAIISI
jgi:hypothetical protein